MVNIPANISTDCVELVKHFEAGDKFIPYPYVCPSGYWTIGYGCWFEPDMRTLVTKNTPRLKDEAAAFDLLKKHLLLSITEIRKLVKVDLNQHQLDALVSFEFNLVEGAFKRSTLLRMLNYGMYDVVPRELRRWNKSNGKPSPGLIRRRNAEVEMWLGHDWKLFKR